MTNGWPTLDYATPENGPPSRHRRQFKLAYAMAALCFGFLPAYVFLFPSLIDTREVNSVTFEIRDRRSIGSFVLSEAIRPSPISPGNISPQDRSKGVWLLSYECDSSGRPGDLPLGGLENQMREMADCWADGKATNVERDRDRKLIRAILGRRHSFVVLIDGIGED